MFDPANPPTPADMTLSDGRTLAWYEFGDPQGLPCVYNPGTPCSGLGGAVYDDAARAAGIRWISVDRPGFGRSDFQPGRTLRDWAGDIDQLAEHLRLDRFATVGESGGGPYTLAIAAGLPERLTCAVVIAGLGRSWGDDPDGKLMPANRALAAVIDDPAEVGRLMAESKAAYADPIRSRRRWDDLMPQLPACDREAWTNHPALLAIITAAGADALRDGVAGAVHELTALRPWNVELSAITTHVHLWHGTEDANVPIAAARRIAAELPHHTTHWLDGVGHAIALVVMDDIMATIRSAVPSHAA